MCDVWGSTWLKDIFHSYSELNKRKWSHFRVQYRVNSVCCITYKHGAGSRYIDRYRE